MYPNPANDVIFFSNDADLIEIYDLSGKRLMDVEQVKSNQSTSITGLDSGYYLVKIINQNNIETKKLIIH